MRLLSILALLALSSTVLCEEGVLKIFTPSDFFKFVNSVNSGNDYKKTTVFLEATLDLSEYAGQMDPIGKDQSTPFSGVFDGQGFALGYFLVNTTNKYAGLFGYSKGTTIRNIVFSMTNVMNIVGPAEGNAQLYAGGIIGRCEKVNNPCKIENSVNIANVTFTGKTNSEIYLGGIAGYIYSRHESHIRNCANYGMVASFGRSNTINIGGIVGFYGGSSSKSLTVSNCLNLCGIIPNCNNVETWHVGGIVGRSEYSIFDNCVSTGKIVSTEIKSEMIGSLSGKSSYTTFKNCYWNESTWALAPGTETEECASYNSSFILNKTITAGNYIGNVLLDALNTAVDYYVLYDYSHWGYSTGKFGVDFTINGRTKHFDLDNQLLLLPGLSPEGSLTFDGWYSDKTYTKPLTEYVFVKDSEVFGRWTKNTKLYTISFDLHGGSPAIAPITKPLNTLITLPNNPTKGEKCSFIWWENDYGDKIDMAYTIPAHNVTLHAVWGCTEITSARDLIGMAKIVNSGENYKSATITLNSDIVFTDEESKEFISIGIGEDGYFEGTFDGHGYTISNLNVRTSVAKYGGLFGYSKGAIIRNVVMDSTCSVISTYGSGSGDEESFFGSLFGYCETHNGPCILENSVSMADIIFNGESSSNIFIGGLIGRFYAAYNHEGNITNCVNYGTVTHTGKRNKYANIGGIAGGCIGKGNGVFVRNCMNYGGVFYTGESKTPCIGGLIGYSTDGIYYENCVSFGGIVTTKTSEYIGAITGEFLAESTIKNCYWDKTIDYEAVGFADSTIKIDYVLGFDPSTLELVSAVSVGTYTGKSLVDALNNYENSDPNITFSKWAGNKNMNTVTFMINNRAMPFLVLKARLVLVPNFTKYHGGEFLGWFSDANYTVYFNLAEFTEDTTIYGTFQSDKKSDEPKSYTSFVILNYIILVLIILCVAALVIAVGFLLWNRFNPKHKTNKEIHELMEPMLLDKPENSIDYLGLYPENYVRPSLKEALINAGIEEVLAERISSMCYRHADNLTEEKKLPKGVTLDDVAAIAAYTMETDDLDQSPYMLINEALIKGNILALEPVKDLLYLVMRALRKMPIVYNKTLYRGIRNDIFSNSPDGGDENSVYGNFVEASKFSMTHTLFNTKKYMLSRKRNMFRRGEGSFEEDYLEGEETVWPALSPTSTNVAATKAFLAIGTESKKAEGTLFMIEDGWGYNVQSCSMFPGEEEIVLEPERRFKVKTVIPGDGLTIIKMEMLRTPFVLPEVFGEVKGKASKIDAGTKTDKRGSHYGFSGGPQKR